MGFFGQLLVAYSVLTIVAMVLVRFGVELAIAVGVGVFAGVMLTDFILSKVAT